MLKSMMSSIVAKKMQRKLINATISEENIIDVIREIRITLLDADVNIFVVKTLIKNIKEAAIGTIVGPDENIDDVILLIIKEELLKILGKEVSFIDYKRNPLKIMMVGLQGSGKTTTCGKIANLLIEKEKKKPLIVALDIYRPAAIEQLRTVAKTAKADFFEKGNNDPIKTAKESLKIADEKKNNLIIYDTAGRLQTNEALMQELINIKKTVKPDEILLVVDGMSGQDVINVAKEFNDKLKITGIVITKLDSDARAGAALSLTSLLSVPIKFTGIGERINQIDIFYPERIVDRILGYGDMMTLAEKAASAIDETSARKSIQKMLSGKMDLEDLMRQMDQLKNMGSMNSLFSMLPTGANISEDKIHLMESQLVVWKVLLSSMTIEERRNPSLIRRNNNRRIRIIKGSGRKPDELNKLLSRWEKSSKQMFEIGKQIKKGNNPLAAGGLDKIKF
ncbi:MAG: signal recognition particle protein [Mycoplasmoidaceae bacterium]